MAYWGVNWDGEDLLYLSINLNHMFDSENVEGGHPLLWYDFWNSYQSFWYRWKRDSKGTQDTEKYQKAGSRLLPSSSLGGGKKVSLHFEKDVIQHSSMHTEPKQIHIITRNKDGTGSIP